MEIVKRWLTGTRNFITGTVIYSVIGRNPHLKALLAKGKTPHAEELLLKELSNFSLTAYLGEKADNPAPSHDPEVMRQSDDKILQAFYNDWQPQFQRLNYLRHSLDKEFDDMNSDEAIAYRKPIAFEILETEQRIKQIWTFRDHYTKTGKLPYLPEAEETTIPTDPDELKRFVANVKKNIRRNRQLMQEQPGEPRYVKLYDEYKSLHLKATGKNYEETNRVR